jgi:hypothetical protein
MSPKILWEANRPCMFPYANVKYVCVENELKITFDYFEEKNDAIYNTGFVFKWPFEFNNFKERVIPESKMELRKNISVCGLTEILDSGDVEEILQ